MLIFIHRYLELYPERQQPNKKTFYRISINFRKNGCVTTKTKSSSVTTQQRQACRNRAIRDYFENNPESSIRKSLNTTGCSIGTTSRVLKQLKVRPYKFQRVQNLRPGDCERTFVCGLLNSAHKTYRS